MRHDGLISSRIPWLRGGYRCEAFTGCSNTPKICPMAGLGGCWAEAEAVGKLSDEDLRALTPHAPPNCMYSTRKVMVLDDRSAFKPTFHPERLRGIERRRTPSAIAMNLSGDMWCKGVREEDRRTAFRLVERCSWHQFIFLTKCPENIDDWPDKPNVHMGVSVCRGDDWRRLEALYEAVGGPFASCNLFASFEPLMEHQPVTERLLRMYFITYVIIGGQSRESENGGKYVLRPDEEEGGMKPEDAQVIIDAAHKAKAGIFLKNVRREALAQIRNPRTGMPLRSMSELRDNPPWFANLKEADR